jgi:hypothetical protein
VCMRNPPRRQPLIGLGSSNAREQHSILNGEGHMDFLPGFGALLYFLYPHPSWCRICVEPKSEVCQGGLLLRLGTHSVGDAPLQPQPLLETTIHLCCCSCTILYKTNTFASPRTLAHRAVFLFQVPESGIPTRWVLWQKSYLTICLTPLPLILDYSEGIFTFF